VFQQFVTSENFERAWRKVASNHGGAGVDGETIEAFAGYQSEALSQLRQLVAAGRYYPLPLRQFFLPKQDGDRRELRIPTVRDRIVQQALLQILHSIAEPQFESCSFAYRPGRSHLMAVERVVQWRDRGFDWVLEADIIRYFDHIEHARLLVEMEERLCDRHGRLLPRQDRQWILAAIAAWISAGTLTPAGIVLPEEGVPQGAVVSPLLSNIYLDDFDEAMAAEDGQLVRFADDFVWLGRSREGVEQARQRVTELLASMGLELHPEKTRLTTFDRGFRFLGHGFVGDLVVPLHKGSLSPPQPIAPPAELRLVHAESCDRPSSMQLALVEALKDRRQPIPPPLFVVLGYKVRPDVAVAIASQEIAWRNGMSSLYVVQQGTLLQKEHDRFSLQSPDEGELEIPIREVERILVFGNVQLSTAAIATCLQLHIPVVFLSQLGDYKGHLWSAEFGDLQAEFSQFQRWQESSFQLTVAKAIVQGKLLNSRQLLLRLNRKRQLPSVDEAIAGIASDLQALESAPSLEALRGYEGSAAARYFPGLGKLLVNSGFTFEQRNRRPPKDPVNSLLSFGYTLLFNNVLSLLLAEGLNPYLGNLHRSEGKTPDLALDLMEEFRSPVVDSLVVTLVNRKTLQPTDFTWPTAEGGVYLQPTARRVFLKAFEERLNLKVSHPDVKEKISYRRAIQLQVQRYKVCLAGQQLYEAFLRAV
jgi:CRISPR-associated protein Cas1